MSFLRRSPGSVPSTRAVPWHRAGTIALLAVGLVSAGGDRGSLEPEEVSILAAFFTAALLRAEALVGTSRTPTPSPLPPAAP